MKRIRYGVIVLWMLTCWVTSASAQVSISIGLPNVSIGINLPLFPELTLVPGYPVYYAPRVDANYFFYDGMYWVYQGDNWYASSWYNGPWWIVEPEIVPLFILRIPVRYYRQPPVYFRGWQSNAPPRWGQHWGHQWEQRRSGWDRWNRRSAPAPAPLPVYQRQYSGDRYPRQVEQQQTLHRQSYRYEPRDKVVREQIQPRVEQRAPASAPRGRQQEPAMREPKQQDTPRSTPIQPGAPAGQRPQPPQRGGEDIQKSAPVRTSPQQRGPAVQEQKQQRAPAVQEQKQQRAPAVQEQKQQRAPAVQEQKLQPGAAQREQKAPKLKGQEQKSQDDESQEPKRGRGQGQDKDEERGRGRDN